MPAAYQPLYDHLASDLDAYESAVDAMPDAPASTPLVKGAELLAANGNRLAGLLAPNTLGLVDESLDRLHALHVGGVTLGIKVPMLLDSFSPDAGRYADFYATVAEHVRARGMVVSVELGVLFCGTAFAQCTNPYGAGTYQSFVDDTVAQARIVIERLHPDYLTLVAEPDTEAKLTGIRVLGTPTGAARAVGDILAGIGERGSTRVGAGAGTWLPTSFADAIAAEPVDYLDTHTYPVGGGVGANAVAIAAVAQRAHLSLVVDEVWLYKTDQPGIAGGPAAAEQVFRQDVYSFWEPLDERFLAITSKWAHKAGAAYVSPFWSWQFFTYLDWSPQLDAAPYAQLTQAFNRVVAPALTSSQTTAVGHQWGDQ
ncbi:MAG TPA: hypothetical protein VFV00_17420 [Acidimicrobiales bacterium]|nr:hypothetical protein [Acidimicrobiales bacterium]